MTLHLRASVVVAVLLSVCGSRADEARQPAGRRQLCKVDAAAGDPTWVAFLRELTTIVRARDAAQLRSLTDPDVLVGLDGLKGLDEFARLWDFQNPKAEFWNEMDAILKVGGSAGSPIEDGIICMPYVNCLGPEFGDPAYDAVILGQNVPAYERPSTRSVVSERLTCAVLATANKAMGVPPPAPQGWTPVIVGSRWLFVRDEQIRMIAGVEAHFKRVGTQWKLIAFYAGD